MMRVRSVEKIGAYGGDRKETVSFDMSSDEFFKKYKLMEMVPE